MTEIYRDKTIRQIESEFDNMINNNTAYRIWKLTGTDQAILSKVKHGERNFSLEKKIEMLEKFYNNTEFA